MDSVRKTRFRKTEEALRFFFRVHELLIGAEPRRLLPKELPERACSNAVNAVDDYQCIGWCMRGLDEIKLWLLSELYGPTAFGVHRRTYAQACEAGRVEFPRRQFRLKELSSAHSLALKMVGRRLIILGMVPNIGAGSVQGGRTSVHKPGSCHGARAAN
ncbi:MAG: hypothetical protein JWM69_1668 [Candidatus Binatus sp.]|jgi:hypothetical protein|nr:hypothetical protein [Candidatus Binatus sp.]